MYLENPDTVTGAVASLVSDSITEGDGDELDGIASYYRHVRDAEGFETTVLPVGEGLSVSVRTA